MQVILKLLEFIRKYYKAGTELSVFWFLLMIYLKDVMRFVEMPRSRCADIGVPCHEIC